MDGCDIDRWTIGPLVEDHESKLAKVFQHCLIKHVSMDGNTATVELAKKSLVVDDKVPDLFAISGGN
ncbi:hypothetical protein GOBAR_DD00016 [Gossypium barbadense]|nr:hypothetical protein GOBAR_DD00016 [Gossypium barbadense]